MTTSGRMARILGGDAASTGRPAVRGGRTAFRLRPRSSPCSRASPGVVGSRPGAEPPCPDLAAQGRPSVRSRPAPRSGDTARPGRGRSGPRRSSRTITWSAPPTGIPIRAPTKAPRPPPIAAQGGADQDGEQHPEGVEPHGLAHDDRVEDVVLHLLVGQEDDQHDDARRHRVDGGDDHDRHPGQQAADQRQQVDQGHEDAEEHGERHAEDGQGDRRPRSRR